MPGKRQNSYPAAFKLQVIKFAEENGNRLSTREYKIDETNVQHWRKQKNVLGVINLRKRAKRGRKPFGPN